MRKEVGVIGLGNMGFGIASNLLKAGFHVFVYDIRPEPMDKLKAKGAVAVSGVREMARSCPLVFSVLLDYKQNLDTLTGPDGLFEGMEEGGSVFVCSTLSPAQVRELAAFAQKRGIHLLDAPMSGGIQGAEAGTLSIMIGGDAKVLEKNRKALEAISSHIFYMGEVGAGESAKSINQMLVATHNVAAAEAMIMASKSGINLRQMYDIIQNSAGYSWMFEHRAMRMIERDFKSRGVLRILLKDTNIVMESAQSLGVVLPILGLVRQLFQAGVNAGLGDEDDSAIVKVLEKLSCYQLKENKKKKEKKNI
jgi:3-hydroxyisobutyrate dehydrogenase-like beta-hydroxyacid dehydrogenase